MRLDFASNDDNTLLIQNGDFVIQNSELTQAKRIIYMHKGELRQYPLLGVGIESFIGSSIYPTILYNLVDSELTKDDLVADEKELTITDNSVDIQIKMK